jgi:hypothetical protein
MSSGARPGSIMSVTWGSYDTAVWWVCPGTYSAPPEPTIGYCYTSGNLPPERWRELEKLRGKTPAERLCELRIANEPVQ